jgi:hypothetical protein
MLEKYEIHSVMRKVLTILRRRLSPVARRGADGIDRQGIG